MYIRIKIKRKGGKNPHFNTLKISFILFFSLITINKSICQQDYFSVYSGICYGGPIPTKIINNSSGKALSGLTFGFSFNYKTGNKITLKTDLQYTNKRVSYNTYFRKDTLIPQQINNSTYYLNSFYNAYVNGEMNLHYIENHYSVTYQIFKKTQLYSGLYLSLLCGGYDKGQVQVVIGEGGFLGDYFEKFDNINNINKLDYGLNFGIKSYLYKNIYSEFKISRSIKTLYSKDIFSNRDFEKNYMYHTYAFFLIGIDIK